MVFKNSKIYDALVYVAQIVLPAVIVLIAALGTAWDWDGQLIGAVNATLAAVDVFMGALLKVSSINYHKKDDAEEV